MRYLATNDWHFAKQNPASRKDDYNGELFDLLGQILRVVQALRVDVVGISGDLFHNKGVALWDTVIRLVSWGTAIRQAGARIIAIAGNHDETHDRYESLGQTPFGLLVATGLFEDISRRTWTGPDGIRFYGVPWPDGGKPDAFAQVPAGTDVVLAHGFATTEGIERWGTHCHKYSDLPSLAPSVRLWHFGHDHSDRGVFKLSNGGQVINIGALARGALDHDSILRDVKIAVADLSQEAITPTVTQYTLQQKRADEIFDLERHHERVREQQHLDAFLDGLQSGLSSVLDVDYLQVLAGMQLDDNVRTRVRDYIARAEAGGT